MIKASFLLELCLLFRFFKLNSGGNCMELYKRVVFHQNHLSSRIFRFDVWPSASCDMILVWFALSTHKIIHATSCLFELLLVVLSDGWLLVAWLIGWWFWRSSIFPSVVEWEIVQRVLTVARVCFLKETLSSVLKYIARHNYNINFLKSYIYIYIIWYDIILYYIILYFIIFYYIIFYFIILYKVYT